tara:strand:- start:131 stop:655 length:525 start_codon:yes stop_codon:yes gene_type:complete
MIPSSLFTIPMWSLPTLNFSEKKKQLEKLVKAFPEKKHGVQTFATNRQSDRTGFAEAFTNIVRDELEMLSKRIEKDIHMEDIWSVSYKKGDYHTPHNHGATGLTGILYLNMPKDGPVTQYIQPWNDWLSDRTIYYPLPVVEGTIVVVPKFVRHFTEPSKSKKIKRIISWDMKIS